MTVLVGRETELTKLLGCLGYPGPRCATVIAAPGLGKTALVTAFTNGLADSGATVLAARPREAEAQLSFSTLGELLEPVPEEQYDELPAPQRRALRVALLHDEGDTADPRAVAAGFRAVLTANAERDDLPLVVVIDDAQWLDDASSTVLGLVLRRVDPIPLLVVASARPTGRPVTEWLPHDWPRVDVDLQPLTSAALFHVVREHLNVTLDRGQLHVVERASGGNPLHALEFARHRVFGPGASFEALLADRLLALPRPTRRALLGVALCTAPTVVLVAEALHAGTGEVLDALEPAVADRLVRVGETVQFQHPLYLEAAVDAAAAEERLAMHRRLSEVEPLEEARVRHLARASATADAALAQRLDEAAHEAWDRGAWAAATELLRLAVDRTPRGDGTRETRLLVLGAWLIRNGSPAAAESVLEEVRRTTSGAAYWEATIELAGMLDLAGRYDEAQALQRGLDLSALPVELRARAMFELDWIWDRDGGAGRSDHRVLDALTAMNDELARLPGRPGLARLRAEGLTFEARTRYRAGQRADSVLDRAIELDRLEPVSRFHESPLLIRAEQLIYRYDHDAARTAHAELHRRAIETGDDVSLPFVSSQWAYLELRAGDWARSQQLAEEGMRVAEEMGQDAYLILLNLLHAGLQGLRGDRAGALARLAGLRPKVEALDEPRFATIWWVCEAYVRNAYGESEEAYRAATESWRRASATGWRDPAFLGVDTDLLDAMIATGRVQEAQEHLGDACRRAREAGRDPVLTELGRCRLALMAARGDLEQAVAEIPATLAAFDGPHRPLERARAHLGAGNIYRRAGAKRLAHQTLTSAKQQFEAIGCPPYADQAAAALGRVGLRPRAEEGLTGSERQIASLAATGLHNAEIAGRAFVSAKTVEATLTRAYRKLGIHSRAELARALDAYAGRSDDSDVGDPPTR